MCKTQNIPIEYDKSHILQQEQVKQLKRIADSLEGLDKNGILIFDAYCRR